MSRRKGLTKRESLAIAGLISGLILGVVYLVSLTLKLVWKMLLWVGSLWGISNPQPSKKLTLDSYLGKSTLHLTNFWRDRWYTFFNWFLIFGGLMWRDPKASLLQVIMVASILGFIFFASSIIVGTFAKQTTVLLMAFPFGLFARKVEVFLGKALDDRYQKRRDKLFIPYLADIGKFAAAHAKTGGTFARPVNDPLELSEEDFKSFCMLLKTKGCELPAQVLADALNEQASLYSVHEFKKAFLSLNPNLANGATIETWATTFVEHFHEDQRYIINLCMLMQYEGVQFPKGAVLAQEITLAVGNEITRRATNRKLQRIQGELDSGVAARPLQINDIDLMGGHQFEKFLESLFSDMGFKVTPTRQTSDQGADILLEKFGERYVVQAKCYSQNVGNSAIQEVVAAKQHYKCTKAIVITNQAFTRQAIELANSNNVELWDRSRLTRELHSHPQRVQTGSAA